ncbi:MAG: hypothetical protein Q9225_003506 [Loekoesia sp. 1 TL-2023]
MELLEGLDPPVELKVPLPDIEPPDTASLETINRDAEGTPILETSRTEIPQAESPVADDIDTVPLQPREESYGGATTEAREETKVEQANKQRPDQANMESVKQPATIQLLGVKDLIDLEHYHRSQTESLKHMLDNLALTDGLNRRLIPSLSTAYQAMADFYQIGDQSAFISLYQACEDISEACKGHAIEERSHMDLRQPLFGRSLPHPDSWLERLPQDCQNHILDFITRLRIEPHFLADRLSALSFGAFAELLSHSSTSQNLNSVFGAHHQRQISGHNQNFLFRGSPPTVEKLRQFQKGDPLFLLFHVVFNSSCGPGTKEYLRRTQVWSTACARVIAEGKPGSDALTLTTLDAFSGSRNWHLAPQVESYIANTLQEGAFLADPALTSSNKSMEPLEIRNANAAIATSKFFDKALKDLLAILLNTSPSNMMPDGVLHLIRSILINISNIEVRNRARKFIISKWFISSFLGRILTYPEVSEPKLAL